MKLTPKYKNYFDFVLQNISQEQKKYLVDLLNKLTTKEKVKYFGPSESWDSEGKIINEHINILKQKIII